MRMLLLGFVVSILGGWVFAALAKWLIRDLYIGGHPEPRSRVPASLTGIIERFFFTTIVAYDVSGAATAMIAWLGLKLASNWNRSGQTDDRAIAFAFQALLTGLVSLLFAVVGGLIARGSTP